MKNTTPKERRQEVRFPCSVEAVCLPAGDDNGLELTARVKDISENGIGLLVPQPFPAGALIEVQIPTPDGEEPTLSRLLLVVHSRPEPNGSWTLGGEFHNELSYEEVESLRSY